MPLHVTSPRSATCTFILNFLNVPIAFALGADAPIIPLGFLLNENVYALHLTPYCIENMIPEL